MAPLALFFHQWLEHVHQARIVLLRASIERLRNPKLWRLALCHQCLCKVCHVVVIHRLGSVIISFRWRDLLVFIFQQLLLLEHVADL